MLAYVPAPWILGVTHNPWDFVPYHFHRKIASARFARRRDASRDAAGDASRSFCSVFWTPPDCLKMVHTPNYGTFNREKWLDSPMDLTLFSDKRICIYNYRDMSDIEQTIGSAKIIMKRYLFMKHGIDWDVITGIFSEIQIYTYIANHNWITVTTTSV